MDIMLDSDKIDWVMLREQKANMSTLLSRPKDRNLCSTVEGILSLIDYIQDQAADVMSEEEIFGVKIRT